MSFEVDIPDLRRLPGVREAVAGDAAGKLVRATPAGGDGGRRALHAASLLRELQDAGRAAALGALDSCVVKGAGGISVTVLRAPLFVQAALDPGESTAALERALGDWHPQRQEAQAAEVAEPAATVAAMELARSPAEAVTRASRQADPWSALRRTLVRAQLADASALREALGEDGAGRRPGAEALEPALRERAMDGLLEGIGSVLAGDALGGLRTLKEVASEAQGNLSFRWVGLHWSALGAVQCNGAQAARGFARQAVLLSRQLDAEAQAVSHWAAAEVLAAEGDLAKALDWSAQARIRFERLADTWGLGRVCFAEARILAVMGREEEAEEAARRARLHDPAWDDPAVFLARRSLRRGALEDAEELVRMVGTAPAERVRLVAQAVRQGALSQADAIELLQHLDAAPTPESAKALDRLTHAAPRLSVSREALAWMLLKAGRYAEAGKHFTALAGARLPPAIRSSVMLGLGCVAHGQQAREAPEARLRAAVQAGEDAPVDPGASMVPAPLTATAAAAAAGAVFSGKLSVFAVPDLLEFLRGARRTGVLLCSAAAGTATLQFRDGRIAGARSPSTPSVAELLLRARALSAVTLQPVLDRQPAAPRRDGALGEVLVREGLVGIDVVRTALREQIALSVKEILAWREGEFAFNREEPGAEAAPEITVEVDPQEVLLNVLKDMDEAARDRALT